MGKPKAPKPPDPRATAQAQTGQNIGTAIANTRLGQVDQYTPYGNLTYNQVGEFEYVDPLSEDPDNPTIYRIPKFEAITELTPAQQEQLAASQGAELNLALTAQDQSAFLRDYLNEPADLSTEAVEGRLYELGSRRIDPRFERQREGLRTRLANQGISPDSEAYRREMEGLSQAENDAYTQLFLQGRGQAFGEAQAERNQPINEITALLSGSQVNQPSVNMAQPSNIANVDYAGLVNQNFAQRQANYQQELAQGNQLLGGLFGLAAGGLSGGYF